MKDKLDVNSSRLLFSEQALKPQNRHLEIELSLLDLRWPELSLTVILDNSLHTGIFPFAFWADRSTECVNELGITGEPASHTHFNNYPLEECLTTHPDSIQWVIGCSVHYGDIGTTGTCPICELEKLEGMEYPTIPLREKIGYPKDRNSAFEETLPSDG